MDSIALTASAERQGEQSAQSRDKTLLGRLKVLPSIGERVINHSKGVLEETNDLWDYFDKKRDALERLENYLLRLRDKEGAADSATGKQAPPASRRAQSRAARSRSASAPRATR